VSLADRAVAMKGQNPGWTPAQIADELRRTIPGCSTTAASVGSMLSKAKVGSRQVAQSQSSFAPFATGAIPAPALLPDDLEDPETPEERAARIAARFAALARLADRAAQQKVKGLVISGPPGLGKSHSVEEALERHRPLSKPDEEAAEDDPAAGAPPPYRIVRGAMSAAGLYEALWHQRDGVLMLDDADDVLRDETALNLLKAVLDTTSRRFVSWGKMARWLDEEGIPKQFEFRGTVVFCTNIDFQAASKGGGALAPHLSALLDRALYLPLDLRTVADVTCRIRQVAVGGGMLESRGLTPRQAEEVCDFIEQNATRFHRLSLRLASQVADAMLLDPDGWHEEVKMTRMVIDGRP
jgi:hypothetical protein